MRSRRDEKPARARSPASTTMLSKLSHSILLCVPLLAAGQGQPPSSLEQRVQSLEERQRALERQLEQRGELIEKLERERSVVDDPKAPGSDATAPQEDAGTSGENAPEPALEDTGTALAPGRGLLLGESDYGSVTLSAYAVARALTQRPSTQTAIDHLGREYAVDTRRDIQLHRVMIHLRGWFLDPKFTYQLTTWTVNDTEQVRVIGSLMYQFNEAIRLSVGYGGTPGTRSLGGSHPFWLGHDRVMADEYFRTGFSAGIWLDAKLTPTLNYKFMVANNISSLGVSTVEDTRDLAYGNTFWWMPTTGEFGPQGAYGDFELHQDLATRFGISYVRSPKEDRAAQPSQNSPDTTQIRLGDSLLLFQTGALGDGVTVQKANFEVLSMDAGFKYKGFFLQTEVFHRALDTFEPSLGSLEIPVRSIRDKGFYVQGGFFPIPQKLELYAATSQIYPDEDAGYDDSSEFVIGANWYWRGTRYQRVNFQLIDVRDSPASSAFGYYTGGMDGKTFSVDVSMLF